MATQDSLIVKEQSLYRALRRFVSLGLVTITKHPSPEGGPDRKYYELTETGHAVLKKIVSVHINPLLSEETIKLLHKI